MKMKLRALVPAILAMTFSLLHAETKANPAMVVQVILTENNDDYLALLAKSNARIKAVTGIEQLRHAWVGDFAGENSHGLVVVSNFESAAAGEAVRDKLGKDAEMNDLLKEFAKLRKLGPAYLYKAMRWEGLYPGGAVFNTTVTLTDEAAYLKALDGLKAIFDANGFKDAKVNLFRLASGREDSTHLVVICFANRTRVAELIDMVSDTAALKDWNASVAKIRTTVRNGTYHEVTK